MKTQTITTKQKVLKPIGILGLIMIFSVLTNPLLAQNNERIVTGIVSSIDGPLVGATIILKGTSSGVSSDENGAFTFPRPLKENDVLVISYLGYETKRVKISDKTAFIEPVLKDIPVFIVAASRTQPSKNIPVK